MGANPLSTGMRRTFFGPLIKEVEQRIIGQMGANWDRDLFENHLMGCTLRTGRHRYVEWRDYRNPAAAPLFVELYDHQTDPTETVNVARRQPGVVSGLRRQLRQLALRQPGN